MWRNIIGITLFIFTLVGCQPSDRSDIEEVVNTHGNIKNLEGLKAFVEKVNNQQESEINYVRYGIEGQRGVMTLTSNGDKIKVSHYVDKEFIEEYYCKNLITVTEEDVEKYILSQCTGDYVGDFELLSISNKDM
ncbi:DUF4362 domain-containing protein [Paenibacillus sp. LMG 31458]|uniref:DUF4362 domain-containing protein n=1 Tax=Paenibacillus phytorum TaxID=2654977 RepID=A0ABX1XP17_9BACL|nr:DUF4362 domain-containing protein [Paenibacillus phytorum]NOU70285.1 DUF4362 domain-containing protein [Paenibacillus phytorum]